MRWLNIFPYVKNQNSKTIQNIRIQEKEHPKHLQKKSASSPFKIVSERWCRRKRKPSAGHDFYQTNKPAKVEKRKFEVWGKLQVIPWEVCTFFHLEKTIRMHPPCVLDSFLEILFFFYALNLRQMKCLFDSENKLVAKIYNILQLLLTNDFDAAKYFWKKFILSLVFDPLLKYHARSDRLPALQRLSSIRRFENNAEKEMTIIRLEMRDLGGRGGEVLMYVNLTFFIFARTFCKNHDHLTLMILQIAVVPVKER